MTKRKRGDEYLISMRLRNMPQLQKALSGMPKRLGERYGALGGTSAGVLGGEDGVKEG